jgi:uncharacterized RDD family membrane protein YckC
MTAPDSSPALPAPVSRPAYASFSARALALVTDLALTALGLVFLVFVGTALDQVPGSGRVEVALLWSLVLLYEPLLVSRRGATIGHRRYGLRVVMPDGARPSFPRAFARYVVKAILGILSFVPMFLTRRHQALQDLLTQTQVVVDDPAGAPAHLVVLEREPTWLDDVAPLWRRLVVIVVYLIVLLVAFVIAYAFVPSACVAQNQCTEGQRTILKLITLGWLAGNIAIVVAGLRGSLPGARRRRQVLAAVPVT